MKMKEECENLYKIIKNSQDRLEQLREICKHEETHIGNYSWRVGSVENAEICNICGKKI